MKLKKGVLVKAIDECYNMITKDKFYMVRSVGCCGFTIKLDSGLIFNVDGWIKERYFGENLTIKRFKVIPKFSEYVKLECEILGINYRPHVKPNIRDLKLGTKLIHNKTKKEVRIVKIAKGDFSPNKERPYFISNIGFRSEKQIRNEFKIKRS